jgi:hypothetical protein
MQLPLDPAFLSTTDPIEVSLTSSYSSNYTHETK